MTTLSIQPNRQAEPSFGREIATRLFAQPNRDAARGVVQSDPSREALLAGPTVNRVAGLGAPNASGAMQGLPERVAAAAPATRVQNDVIVSPHPEALFVAASVSGTVDVIDPETRENLGWINVVPDLAERLAEIEGDFFQQTILRGIEYGQVNHEFEPSDGIRTVDDLSVSPDGTRLYVSRSNLGDVIAIDLTTEGHPIVWRTPVSGGKPFGMGRKADHADLSPDGRYYAVSSTLAERVDVFDTETGEIVWHFDTGSLPHQVDWVHLDASIFDWSVPPGTQRMYLVNAGIGHFDGPEGSVDEDEMAHVTVVDPMTQVVVREYIFEHGIRPAVFTEDGRYMVFQQSHFNGLKILDLATGDIVASEELSFDENPTGFRTGVYQSASELPHASEVHGLAGDGSYLITAATAHAAVGHWRLVYDSEAGHPQLEFLGRQEAGNVPYWVAATADADGDLVAAVSESADDRIGFYDFETGQHLGDTELTGSFPQRARPGVLSPEAQANLRGLDEPVPDALGALEALRTRFYDFIGHVAYKVFG